jgi:hypothetical protein
MALACGDVTVNLGNFSTIGFDGQTSPGADGRRLALLAGPLVAPAQATNEISRTLGPVRATRRAKN